MSEIMILQEIDAAMRSNRLIHIEDPIILYASEQTRCQVSYFFDDEYENIENFVLFNNDPIDLAEEEALFSSMFK